MKYQSKNKTHKIQLFLKLQVFMSQENSRKLRLMEWLMIRVSGKN